MRLKQNNRRKPEVSRTKHEICRGLVLGFMCLEVLCDEQEDKSEEEGLVQSHESWSWLGQPLV